MKISRIALTMALLAAPRLQAQAPCGCIDQEEIEGYQAEMQFLQSEFQRLQRICKPVPTSGGGGERDYSSRPAQTDHDSHAPNNAPGHAITPPPAKGLRPLKAPAPTKAPPMPRPLDG